MSDNIDIDRITISDISINKCKNNKLYSYNGTIGLTPLESEINTIKTEMVNNNTTENNINENENIEKFIHINSINDYLDDINSEKK